MNKLLRRVIVGDKVYLDTIVASEMTEIEILKTIAPVEIPRLRAETTQLQELIDQSFEREQALINDKSMLRDILGRLLKNPRNYYPELEAAARQILKETKP